MHPAFGFKQDVLATADVNLVWSFDAIQNF